MPGPGCAALGRPTESAAGTVVAGRYKLLEPIGEEGMGTVWLAEQKEPVKRKVALKLIKAGMDSKAVLARFKAERQGRAVVGTPLYLAPERLQWLLESDPTSTQFLSLLATIQGGIGELSGSTEEALAAYHQANHVQERLGLADPTNPHRKHLATDIELESLRGREDFQKLLHTLLPGPDRNN